MADADLRTAATTAVALDQQFGKVLAERETSVIRLAIGAYRGNTLSPTQALAFWGQMAELHALEAYLERDARRKISAAEAAMEADDGGQ